MPTFCKRVTNLVKKIDVFSTTEFLRYKGEPEYQTLTGGCTSLVVITIFLGFFFVEGFRTANKSIIFSQQTYNHETEPSSSQVTFDPKLGFMLAFFLEGMDLNDPNSTYINISFKQQFFSPILKLINQTQIPLEPCTRAHFSEQGGITQQYYDRVDPSRWKCPPLGTTVTLGGTPTSQLYSVVRIDVSKCNSTTDATCKIDDLFSRRSNLRFIMPTINSLVNAGKQTYRSNYFQDSNYLMFSETLKAFNYIHVKSVAVETDHSLFPLADVQVEQFATFPQNFEQRTTLVESNGLLVQAQLRKSSSSVMYNRRFNKFDEFFSYVGGLVGTVLSVVFIIHYFSEKAFQVNIASEMYKDDDHNPIESDSFHIFYLIMIPIKQLLDYCGSKAKWEKTDLYNRCIEQMEEQLDISLILKRLEYCQKAANRLLRQSDIEPDSLMEVMTLSQAGEARSRFASESSDKDRSPQASDGEGGSAQDGAMVFNEYSNNTILNHSSHVSNQRGEQEQTPQLPQSIKHQVLPQDNELNSVEAPRNRQIRRNKLKSRQHHSAKQLPRKSAQILAHQSEQGVNIHINEQVLTESRGQVEIDPSLFFNIKSNVL